MTCMVRPLSSVRHVHVINCLYLPSYGLFPVLFWSIDKGGSFLFTTEVLYYSICFMHCVQYGVKLPQSFPLCFLLNTMIHYHFTLSQNNSSRQMQHVANSQIVDWWHRDANKSVGLLIMLELLMPRIFNFSVLLMYHVHLKNSKIKITTIFGWLHV